MSRLSDIMARDAAKIHAAGFDLAVAATLTSCAGTLTGTVYLQFGDPTDALGITVDGTADNRLATASAKRSAITTILSRDLVQGDRFAIATGAQAGTWIVSSAVPDDGGGVAIALRLDTVHAAAKVAR